MRITEILCIYLDAKETDPPVRSSFLEDTEIAVFKQAQIRFECLAMVGLPVTVW